MTHTNPAYYEDADAYERGGDTRDADVGELEDRWEALNE